MCPYRVSTQLMWRISSRGPPHIFSRRSSSPSRRQCPTTRLTSCSSCAPQAQNSGLQSNGTQDGYKRIGALHPYLGNMSACWILLHPVRFCLDVLGEQFVNDAGVVLGLLLCTTTGEKLNIKTPTTTTHSGQEIHQSSRR